ncbi:MAG: pyridoxamine 5'-phosphate oxidase family protein [Carbonactinosporaceae bacterium]
MSDRPGSRGERQLQRELGSEERADRFYRRQVLDHLNPRMREFVSRQEMLFVATADAGGECDASLRAGPRGFIQVLSPRTLAYPEYRGNGVMASLGNIRENPHVGLLMIDFIEDVIGLHVNGRARIAGDATLRATHPVTLPRQGGHAPERWVVVSVAEAYIHCSKYIPRLVKPSPPGDGWGRRARRGGGDHFQAGDTPRPSSPTSLPP